MNRKHICLLNAAVLLLCLTACSDDGNSDLTETSASETLSETVSVTEPNIPEMDTTPITLSLYIDGAESDMPFDDRVAAEITKLTGVTLEITHSGGDTDLDTLITSGNLPDMIYAGERTEELIGGGQLVPLDDYISAYGGNFTALYGENFGSLRSDDGKIYTFGTGGSSEAQWTAEGTFQVQYAVLEELGYPEINTLEQLGENLKKYMENHPNTTGLLLCGKPKQQWFDTVSSRVNYVLGLPNDGEFFVDETTGKAAYKWLDPRAGEYVKWLNQMYNDGVIGDASFSLTHDEYVNKLSSGNVLAIADKFENYEAAQTTLSEAGQYDKTYCPLAVTLDGSSKVRFLAEGSYDVPDGIGITTACAEPERAFRFMDWWCGDEAQRLVNYGVETVDYEYDENGKIKLTDEERGEDYAAETGVGLYTQPFPMRGLTERDDSGNFYSSAVYDVTSGYNDSERAALEGYGVTIWADMFPQRNQLERIDRRLVSRLEIPAVSEAGILSETLEVYIKTEVQNAITVPPEEFDAKWSEITEWCRSNGAEQLEALITEMLKQDR